jgi:prepilin-type N-terminal cleavage/methylation domain-containing protein
VIVPVLNEARTIDEVLRHVLAAPYDKQVIVVDDGSTDGTVGVLETWEGHPNVDLLAHSKNRGKGAAIRTGLEHARGRFTIIQDADLEYDPQDYPRLIEPLLSGEAQVVYGSRNLDRRRARGRPWSLFGLGVSLLNVCVRILYGIRVTDEATCYKAFPTAVLRAMDLECERFEFCPEVTAKACRMGLAIHEVPIAYDPRSVKQGKKIRWRDGWEAIETLWRWRNWNPACARSGSADLAELRQAGSLPYDALGAGLPTSPDGRPEGSRAAGDLRSEPLRGQETRAQRAETRAQRTALGFTIIEVLVVISVIGVLMGLLLPAVQASREAGRRTQCASHVKQLGLAVQQHASACGRYPTNGWGYRWVGVPERGTGIEQPGGWIYNILGYLEQGELRELGRGLAPNQQRAALMKLTQMPLPLLACPTRSSVRLLPAAQASAPFNADWADAVAKTDYAINEGDYITDTREGPATLKEGDSGKYPWKDTGNATGIAFQRSEVKPATVRDGLSMTYMLGEKYVTRANYGTASDPGYDQSACSGVDVDINRWVLSPPMADGDEAGDAATRCFGSAHPQGCHFVFCDGSIKLISYQIDGEVHRRLGNRQDGKPVDRGQF